MKHRLFTFLLTIVASTSLIYAEVYSGSCGENLTWSLNTEDSTLTISGTGAMEDYGYKSNQAPWRTYSAHIKYVIINEGATTIGSYAIYGCGALTSVTIPNSVTSIENYAFCMCKSLNPVTIPNNVTRIGTAAFANCWSFESIEIPCNVISIGSKAFYDCGLTSVTFGNCVTSIGSNAFEGCPLASVTFSNSVTNIGSSAFINCTSLASVTIPSNVTNIGDAAFYRCNALKHIINYSEVPQSITTNVFTNVDKNSCTLYVPEESINLYKNATGWNEFMNILPIEGIPASCFIASGTCGAEGDNLTWILTCDSVLIISGIGTMTDYATGKSPWQSFHETIKSISLPEGLTSIGNNAFNGCTGLTSITIPDNVTSIGGSAFYGCSGLTSVTIPNNVTSIGSSAFYNCSGLTSVTIGSSIASIGSSAFSGCSNLTSVTWNAKNCPNFSSNSNAPFYNIRTKITSFVLGSEVEYIPSNLCYGMSNLTSVTIPNNVTSIGSSAFSGCSNLTSVTWNAKNCSNFSYSTAPFYAAPTKITSFVFGDEVEQIPAYLCNGMSNLTSVTIPNNVTSIGSSAFYGCSGLNSVTIPNNVTSIGSSAFYGCSGLTSVTIPNNVTSIGSSAFYGCSGLSTITIPDNVISIGGSAFYNCSGLTSVTIGNSVTNIESSVFSGCNGLTSVTINSNAIVSKKYSSSSTIGSIFGSQVKEYIIGNSVDSIGDYAFYNRSNLESITLGNNITDIGKSAFLGCSNLTSIVIPNSVKNIGNYAFRNCTNLKAVTLGNSVTNINEYTFAGCTSLTSIDIPNGVTSIGSNAFNGCTGLTSVYISDIAAWCAISFRDIYANPLSYAHNLYLNGESVTDLVIPAGVTQIDDYAFYNCSELTSVEIPKGVTSIGSNAFNGCTSLTSIEIPNSVTSIGSNAFDGCNIANINYIGTIEDWCNKTWSVSLLSSNYQLRINGELLEHVTIPIQITNINNTLFSGCNTLISIEIPNTVTNIASNAFSGCTGLTSVVWNAKNCNSYYFGNQVESFTFGEEVEVIPASICSGMTNLRSVIIPNGATSIGNSAFYNCSNLKSVIIPNSITSIGDYAFYNCTGLSFVEWDATEYELTKQLFPSVLDTLAVGAHFDTISLTYLPAKEVILRNPMTVVTNIPRAAIKTNLYDTKGEGQMNAIITHQKYNTTDILIDNLYGTTIDTLISNIAYTSKQWKACNINNDSIIDLHLDGVIYESDGNGGYKQHDFSYPAPERYASAPRKYNHIFQLDANLDGLQDFYSYEDNKHYFQLRQWDGSYLKTELNVLSDTAAIDSAIYQKWEKVSDEFVILVTTWEEISLQNHMFIPNGDPEDSYSTGFDFIDTAIDLDRNGLVDLLSSSTGAVLYNLGDNTYVKGSFPGSVTPKDLNGDGILDYVIYNKTTKTVSLQIYEGNGNTTTKTLMQNMNISNVWCYDFDNDGDIDILLPFDWTSQSGYAYLVFFRNDGNNTFKKIENAFDAPVVPLEFIDCRDVDNDGSYEIIAREFTSSKEYKNYLIRYNNRFKVTLDRSFAAGTSAKSEHLYVYGDFDQNGVNDFYYNTRSTYEYALSRFPYTALNTPPAKMSSPRINVDAEKAMLKISWDRGSDAQTSSLDLEYSIRIGSTSGACDMWFAAANTDGTQRSLWGANVGAYLSQMVNVSTWKAGDYYIAVQAIDPNGLGGEWSDEVVYHHSLLPYGFNVSDHNITTADTITVQYAGAIEENSTYNWNFGDSAVVLSQNGQTYTIIYTTQGNKTVSLQVTSADGRKSPLVTQEVNVLPIRIEKNANYPDLDDKYLALSYFDMDMDGVLDGIGYKTNNYGSWKIVEGFYKGQGDGTFIKLAKTYNSDLSVTGTIGECIFADVNMDGLPDAVVKTSKGNIIYNREDFDAEFSNGTYTLPSAPTPKYDFNNDGRADSYSIKNKHTILLHLNTETGVETVELYLPSDFQLNELESNYLKVSHDFDNNGYPDFISTGYTKAFIIYLHDDYTVSCQYINESKYTSIRDINTYPFVDLNGDGVPDLTEYILKSNIKNEVPAVPTNLRAVQASDGVYLYWDSAKDKETPYAQMRYNISVKKQGMSVGTDNAFVISPVNGLYDEAAIIPGYAYFTGTSYFIPIDKFTGGQTYEFQIQSIDLWNAHSPMSAAYTFTVQPQVLISMPANTCINEPVTVAYTGTNNGAISWNFNGGTASQNSDGTYSVSWSTEGIKTVTATLNGNTSSRVIYVQNAQRDLTFALPERVLNNSWVEVTLPENYLNLDNLAVRTSDNCTGYVLPKKDSRTFRVRFRGTSSTDSEAGWVEFYQNNPVCGDVNTFRDSTLIVGNGSAPAISLVTVDAAIGKNMITWDAPANLPAYVDSVIVYKEEGNTNNWVKQAKVPVSAGQWIDNASDPAIKSYAYCIAYTSVYGGESPKSKAHKTPHLQTNYGLNGAINLYWTYYQGDVVDSYQILRGSSATNMQVFATVAGDECTYTDNSPIENGYYAIAYSNEAFTEEWTISASAANAPAIKRMPQARHIRNGHSNIMASAASVQATLVEQMTILAMERSVELSPSQSVLHLYVETSPISATFKQVKWEIVSGEGLATINSSGLLVANTEGRNGTVRVRATAIDGSGVYAERDITVGGMVVYYTIRFINWNGEVLQSSQVVGGDMPTYNGATPVRAGEGQYVFSFRGWSPDIVIATADADYVAQYDMTAYYTIRFLNWDGTVLQSGLLKEGSIPAYNGETPTREESETYTYTFKEWEPSIAAVTTNADYTAQYDSVAIQYYTIRFLNWDGTVLQSERLREGTYPEYKGETPIREADEYYTYTFRAWSPWPTVVTKDADYTAIYYDTKIPHFTIRFLDWDGDVLQRDYLKEGVMPIYRGETPIHEENDYYTYTFNGWEPEIVAVTTDANYIAQYDSVAIPYYTIRFLNWDGTVLQSESLKTGTMPEYKGETPVYGEEGYYFSRWSPSIVAATANADYIAIYKTCEDLHAIWLQTGEGSGGYGNLGEMEKDSYKWDFDIYRGAYISGSGYDFLRTPAKDLTNMTSITLSFSHLYSDVNNPSYDLSLWVCANYQNNDDDIWQELTIPSYGNWKYVDVIIDVPDNYVGKNTVFGFQYYTENTNARWQIKDLQLDAECIESTSPDPTYYTIRFLNWDGTVLQSSQVEEGSTPSYEGSTPIRPDDEQYTYSFSGWTPTIVAATADADYTAQYTATAKTIGGCQDIHDLWLVTGSNDFGEITTNNAEVWTWDSRYGAVASKSGGITSWLLTPQRDLMGKENITLSFSHVHRYAVDFESEMTLWISADYQGSVESSSWQQLPISPYASNTSWTYVDVVVNVPLDKVGEHTVFGFKYTSTANNYATWEIRNLHLDAQCLEMSTNIENTPQQSTDAVRKVLIDNKIFILRGEKVYTLTGQEVK